MEQSYGLFSILYYIPLYYQVARNYGTIKSGVALFPFTVALGPCSVLTSLIIAETGRYRPSVVGIPTLP